MSNKDKKFTISINTANPKPSEKAVWTERHHATEKPVPKQTVSEKAPPKPKR